MGVIAAHTTSKEDVELVVEAVKYPPLGSRSAGMMRSARWGINEWPANFYENSNRETMIIALVEEPEGIENLDEILSVPELDGVFIGPGDLSLAMGHPGDYDNPDVRALRKQGESRILESGKTLMTIVYGDGSAAQQAVRDGARMVFVTSRYLLGTVSRQWLEGARGHPSVQF
jgi:2-keto-3-deoxy-L-rhamnonate aldolase RhmA